MWKPFLLHSSLPLVQVPSLFFCLCYFFFLLPYPSTWGASCLLGGLTSSASVQWVFCKSSSTCRCISTVSVGRKVISASYSSGILPPDLEYYLTIKRNTLLIHAKIWVIPKYIMLTEGSQNQKDTNFMTLLTIYFIKGKMLGMDYKSVGTKG